MGTHKQIITRWLKYVNKVCPTDFRGIHKTEKDEHLYRVYLEYTYQNHFSTCHLYNTKEDNHILNRWKLGIIHSMKQVVNMLIYRLYMVYTERIPLDHRDCVLYSVAPHILTKGDRGIYTQLTRYANH